MNHVSCTAVYVHAWFETEARFVLPEEEQKKMVFAGSPTQKPGGFAFQPVVDAAMA